MSMGRRDRDRQSEMWVATDRVARSPGHPFYTRLNEVLKSASFDRQVEELCASFYSSDKRGRPSLPPGVYFRMQLIGYFEGLDSERGIAWRCADSLALREFLGFSLSESTPDHSSLCRIRQRLDIEVHQAVFQLILEILSEHGLLRGKTIGIDATTLEANAALRSIVRRDDGTGYDAFLEQLAREAGLAKPRALASALSLLFEGAIVQAYVESDPTAGREARRAAQQLIRSSAGSAKPKM